MIILNVTQSALAGLRISRHTIWGLLAAVVGVLILVWLSQASAGLAMFWLFGLGYGFLVQRSRFCFTSAFRDLFLLQDGRLMKGVLVGLGVATLGFALIMHRAVPDPSQGITGNVYPTGWHTLLGGLLFGTGMVVAGGCASGTLYRMGEGYVAQWIALIGMIVGSFLLALSWEWWWPAVVSRQPKIWFPQVMGWGGAVSITLLVLLGLYLLVVWWETRAGGIVPRREAPAPAATFAERLRAGWETIFVRAWPALLGGAALGVLNILEYLYKKPWGITTAISRWAGWIAYVLGYPAQNLLYYGDKPAGKQLLSHIPWQSGGSLLDWGLIFGAFTAALLAGEFKIRFAPRRRYVQSFLGGVAMGYGARLAMGCNIGGFFSAIPSLALNGWVFGLGLFGGAWIGVQIIKRLP
ncbi:MAG TPA: YeeE/YedE family protein [Caldilineae bacterium]|nr:YeeE/YedE family protein [Caldilineae bacterium]